MGPLYSSTLELLGEFGILFVLPRGSGNNMGQQYQIGFLLLLLMSPFISSKILHLIESWKGSAHKESLYKQEAVQLLKDGIDLITDCDKALSNLLSYPLHATLAR